MDYLLNYNEIKYLPNRPFPVLNLIINGLPSKQNDGTKKTRVWLLVLNLIINGLPSKLLRWKAFQCGKSVLNLIINGLPSKLVGITIVIAILSIGFKPYYKWITF